MPAYGLAGMLLKDEALAKKLHNTIEKLSAIADRLEAGEGSAGRLLKDPSVYNNTDQLLIETRNLIKSMRENPNDNLSPSTSGCFRNSLRSNAWIFRSRLAVENEFTLLVGIHAAWLLPLTSSPNENPSFFPATTEPRDRSTVSKPCLRISLWY